MADLHAAAEIRNSDELRHIHLLSGPWKVFRRFPSVSVGHVSVSVSVVISKKRFDSADVSIAFPSRRCAPDGKYPETPPTPSIAAPKQNK